MTRGSELLLWPGFAYKCCLAAAFLPLLPSRGVSLPGVRVGRRPAVSLAARVPRRLSIFIPFFPRRAACLGCFFCSAAASAQICALSLVAPAAYGPGRRRCRLLYFCCRFPHHSLKIPPKKRRRFTKSFGPLSHVSTRLFGYSITRGLIWRCLCVDVEHPGEEATPPGLKLALQTRPERERTSDAACLCGRGHTLQVSGSGMGGGTVEGCLVTPARSSREEAASRALPRRPRPDAGRRSCLGRPLLPRGPEDAFWLSRSGGHQLSAPLAAGICWASRPSW